MGAEEEAPTQITPEETKPEKETPVEKPIENTAAEEAADIPTTGSVRSVKGNKTTGSTKSIKTTGSNRSRRSQESRNQGSVTGNINGIIDEFVEEAMNAIRTENGRIISTNTFGDGFE